MQQKLDYIHANPVKRGLVALNEHWRYSSAPEWLPSAVELRNEVGNRHSQNRVPHVKLGSMKPYRELVTFIAESVDPQKLAGFRPSKAAQARVDELVAKYKEGALRKDQREELETFLQLEHVMRLAKAAAGARSTTARAA